MKIIERKISDLKPAEYNPRQLSEKEYYDIKASLQSFGMVDPIIVNAHPDRKDIIIGGHQRVKIWQDLGHDTIPTTEVSLPFQREQELNIRLNKNTGRFDYDILANLYEAQDLFEWGFTSQDIGVAIEDLGRKERRNRWIKLRFDEDTYEEVILKLNDYGSTPEEGLLNILKLN